MDCKVRIAASFIAFRISSRLHYISKNKMEGEEVEDLGFGGYFEQTFDEGTTAICQTICSPCMLCLAIILVFYGEYNYVTFAKSIFCPFFFSLLWRFESWFWDFLPTVLFVSFIRFFVCLFEKSIYLFAFCRC